MQVVAQEFEQAHLGGDGRAEPLLIQKIQQTIFGRRGGRHRLPVDG